MNDSPIAGTPWLPADFVHPRTVVFNDEIFLRPIRGEDVDIDLVAVRANRDLLWEQFGEAWGWPPVYLSRESDLEDLVRHADEVERHESFNYAILTAPDGAPDQQLMGCVYIDPPEDGQHRETAHADGSTCEAEVSWWCVADAPGELREGLDAFVRSWITQDWPFDRACTPLNG